MARKRKETDVLDELESQGDVLAEWIQKHATLLIAIVGGSLVAAAAWAGYGSWSSSREEAASEALNLVQAEYVTALGGSPGSIELPELANPAAGAAVREEFTGRFAGVADEHGGTTAATLALLELAGIQDRQGQSEAALETYRRALAGAPGSSVLRAVVLQHIAESHEAAERWIEAAQAHAEAADIDGFELRNWALADAARCYARGGDVPAAIALFERLETEAPDWTPPSHLRELARDLRASSSS